MQVIINEGGLTCTPILKAKECDYCSFFKPCGNCAAEKSQSERQTFEIETPRCSCSFKHPAHDWCWGVPPEHTYSVGTVREAEIVNGKAVIK